MLTETVLKNSGLKLTAPRKEILNILTFSPLSSQEVYELLKQKGIKIDLVTVYRNLEAFEKADLIKRVCFEDNLVRFELIDNNHHHHLICKSCGVIEDVVVDEQNLVSQIKKTSNFEVQKHCLEFFGLCSK